MNGIKYAWDVTKAVLRGAVAAAGPVLRPPLRLRAGRDGNAQYEPKLDYVSPHTAALEIVRRGSRVLDLGCAGGYVGAMLRRSAAAASPASTGSRSARSGARRLRAPRSQRRVSPPLNLRDYDYVLLLDVIEHLASPEAFVERLRRRAEARAEAPRLLVSTANIGFLINRLMLLFGQFNYGKRGILDLTHTRLFTFESFRRLFEQGGFRVAANARHPGAVPAGAQEQDAEPVRYARSTSG